MPKVSRAVLYSLVAGCIWAVIGFGIAWSVSPVRSTPSEVLGTFWGGLVAAPAIGLSVGLLSRSFSRRRQPARAVLALVSLYLAAWLFLVATNAASLVMGDGGPSRGFEPLVSRPLLGALVGLTYTGLVAVLWPLSYLTHTVVGRSWSEA